MTCKNCGEKIGKTHTGWCAHCTSEYMRENNEREDLKPITEDVLDDMFSRYENVKRMVQELKKDWRI